MGSATGLKEKLGHGLNLRHEHFEFQKQWLNCQDDNALE